MKKIDRKNVNVVLPDGSRQKAEKVWFVQYAVVRRHSRILYLPLDTNIVRLHAIKKGDTLKFQLISLVRSPAEDAPLTEDQGEL